MKEERNNIDVINDKVKDKLYNNLFIDVSKEKEDIHPPKICLKCYSKLKNAEKRKTTFKHELHVWKEHHSNCSVCERVNVKQKGGRPKKNKSTGRYSGTNIYWTKADSLTIKTKLPTEEIKILKEDFKVGNNSHLNLCICPCCNEIMEQPVFIINCQHSLCYKCLIPSVEGVKIDTTKCPICLIPISPQSVIQSKTVSEMKECLKTDCEKCGMLFPANFNMENHKKSCFVVEKPETTKLNEVYNLNETSTIPREFEEAALHVIKNKMAKSTLPNNSIEFMTGGSRVSCLHIHILYIYKRIMFLFH